VRFNKGRKEKNQITRRENKMRSELPHTVERYRDAFLKAGFNFEIVNPPYIDVSNETQVKLEDWLKENALTKNEPWIGIAPFAAHKTKIWPIENYFRLVESSLANSNSKFFMFGGGDNEITFFKKLIDRFPNNCIVVAGELSIGEELALIKRLDKMLCVDSSNMHLAALVGTPTVSLWGGTHPSTGFGPFGNVNHNIIQIGTDKLPCRPCSVYGKNSCWRGDFACLNEIPVEQILASL
jgi:ADP-heptose:LPS heptosyltransferase